MVTEVYMRHFVMRRGSGKTMRLIAASEFNNAPIICANEGHRRSILDLSRRYGYKIPMPIIANEILSGKFYGSNTYRNRDFLVDESQDVLRALIGGLMHAGNDCIIGMTTTDPNQ